jgi:hypothetical protein
MKGWCVKGRRVRGGGQDYNCGILVVCSQLCANAKDRDDDNGLNNNKDTTHFRYSCRYRDLLIVIPLGKKRWGRMELEVKDVPSDC